MKSILPFLVLMVFAIPLSAHRVEKEAHRVDPHEAAIELAKLVAGDHGKLKITGNYSVNWDSKNQIMRHTGPLTIAYRGVTLSTKDKDAWIEWHPKDGIRLSQSNWTTEGPIKR